MVSRILIGFLSFAGAVFAARYKRVLCADGVHTATNAACCVFFTLADELQNSVFNHTCFEPVHRALRLSFQDAIGFSQALGPKNGTGADGSIILFPVELNDPANAGIDVAIKDISFLLQSFNVSAGDLIQFAAAVGITNCPGAPRLGFLAGRPNATVPASPGLVPRPQQNSSVLFARMQDAGFTPTDLVSLLAAHSTGHTNTLVLDRVMVPFDTTPFTFDSQFFLEVMFKGNTTLPPAPYQTSAQSPNALAAEGELRLQSDFAVAHAFETKCAWQAMVNNQTLVQSSFKAAMAKVAVVGQNVSTLIDCSEAVPEQNPVPINATTFPAGTNFQLVNLTCTTAPFPSIKTDAGQPTQIPSAPPSETPPSATQN